MHHICTQNFKLMWWLTCTIYTQYTHSCDNIHISFLLLVEYSANIHTAVAHTLALLRSAFNTYMHGLLLFHHCIDRSRAFRSYSHSVSFTAAAAASIHFFCVSEWVCECACVKSVWLIYTELSYFVSCNKDSSHNCKVTISICTIWKRERTKEQQKRKSNLMCDVYIKSFN